MRAPTDSATLVRKDPAYVQTCAAVVAFPDHNKPSDLAGHSLLESRGHDGCIIVGVTS